MQAAQATIDLSPLIDGVVLPLLSTLLLALASWALSAVARFARFQVSDGQRQVVATAITNGIALAEKQLAGQMHVTVDQRVAVAANYVLPKVPDALKALGVTPTQLREIIAARLPQ